MLSHRPKYLAELRMQRTSQRSEALGRCKLRNGAKRLLQACHRLLVVPAHVKASSQPPHNHRPRVAWVLAEPGEEASENVSCSVSLPAGEQMLAMLTFGDVPLWSRLLDRSRPRSERRRFRPGFRGRLPFGNAKSRQDHVVFRKRPARIKPARVFSDASQRSNLEPSHQSAAGNPTIRVARTHASENLPI